MDNKEEKDLHCKLCGDNLGNRDLYGNGCCASCNETAEDMEMDLDDLWL